jgi:hypothetical protein
MRALEVYPMPRGPHKEIGMGNPARSDGIFQGTRDMLLPTTSSNCRVLHFRARTS